MHTRGDILYCAKNVAIVKRGQAVRQSALDADFGRPKFPRFFSFVSDLVRIEEVCVRLARAAAEGAEFASHKADIGEINVAVHHVSNEVADEFTAQIVGGD